MVTVTSKELREILPPGKHLLLDKKYTLPDDNLVRQIVADFVRRRGPFVYVEDEHDCDNAAVEMLAWVSGRGWAFALAINTKHTFNIYVNDKREVMFVEPQTGEITTERREIDITVMV